MPSSSPVPFWMACLMLSAGMFTDLAFSTAVRKRGFELGSPPPRRAAIDISRMILVKTLPRLASRAPFLCLMEAHLECPDIGSRLQPSGGCESITRPGNKKAPTRRHRGLRQTARAASAGFIPARATRGERECARGGGVLRRHPPDTSEYEKSRQRPTLPPGYPGSTIGAGGLIGRVRNGNGCDPSAMVTGMKLVKDGMSSRRSLVEARAGHRTAVSNTINVMVKPHDRLVP